MAYNLGTAEGRIVIDGSGAQKGFSVAEAAASGFANAVNSKVEQIENMGQRLVGIGTAGVAGFGLAVKAASGFEAQLSSIEAVSGATGATMDDIRNKALQLGKDTAFSATEAASAMEELIKAGLSTDDVLNGAADAAVSLAAAGGVDLARAAEIAATAMNQFNLSAEQMPGVVDSIAGAANASAISVEEFNMSLQQVGAVANLAGLSFDETAVAIAELGNAGIKGSDAGTSLKTMLMNLIPTTKAQREEFERLGLITYDAEKAFTGLKERGLNPASSSFEDVSKAAQEYIEKSGGAKVGTQENAEEAQKLVQSVGGMKNAFFDANGELKDFSEVQGMLADATKGMTREQKLASLELMFGSDAVRAAAVFADEGAQGFDKLAESIGKVSAADVAKTRMDNLKGSIEQLKGSFETILITIGTYVVPVVRKFIDGLNALLGVFLNLPAPVQKAIGIFFAIVTVFSLVAGAALILLVHLPALLGKMLLFRTISAATSSITAFFGALRAGAGLNAAVGAMAAPWTRLGTKVMGFAKIGQGVIKVLGLLKGALGWPIVALGLMITYVIWAYNHLDGFRKTVDTVVDALGSMWQWFLGVLKPIGDWLKGEGAGAVTWFKEKWQEALNWLKDNQWILEGIAYIFSGILLVQMTRLTIAIGVWVAKMIWGFTTTAAQSVWSAGVQVASWIATAAKAVWAAGVYVVQTAIIIAQWVLMGIQSALHAAKVAAAWLLTAGINAATAVASTVASVATIMAQWLLMGLRAVAQAAVVAGAWLLSAGVSMATAVASTLVAVATIVGGWIVMAVTAMANAVIAAAAWFIALGPIGWAIAALIAVVAFVIIFWDDIVKWFKAGAEKVAEWMKAAWQWVVDIWNDIVDAFKAAGEWIGSVMDSIGNAISAAWQWIVNIFISAGQGILNAVNQAWNWITSVWNNIINFIRQIPGWIASVFAGAASWLINAGRNILAGLANGIYSAISWVWNGLQSIWHSITGFFSNAGSWLISAGKNIVIGLWNGIASLAGWLWDKAVGWAKSIWDGVTSFFGINSPSRLAMETGAYIVQGLAKGISGNEGDAVKAAVGMANAITDGFDTSLGDLRAMVDGATSLDVTAKMRHQMAADLAGISAGTAAASVGSRVPPSQEVVEHAKQVVNNFNSTVNNPVAEKASDSEARQLRTASAMGAFG